MTESRPPVILSTTPRGDPVADDPVAAALARIQAQVDEEAGRLHARHADRLHCRRGCCDCCVDGITVFQVEAESIRRHGAELLARGEPHPEGGCAFLDGEGACRIYAQRPYVCRTQGLPLRWLDEVDGATVELRDICPLNEAGPPVEMLEPAECWTIGPTEAALAALQARADGGQRRRVALRALFRRSPERPSAEAAD